MQDSSKALHYILGIALAMIAVFVVASLIIVNSQADSVSTSATISNTAPTFVGTPLITATAYGSTDAYAGGTISDLTAGATRTVHLTGTVEDLNSQTDIATVSAVFYRSLVTSGSSCSAGDNDCYRVAACDTSTAGVPATQKKFDCVINLNYYADSTSTGGEFPTENWISLITVTDVGGLSANNTSISKEMQTLLALSIPSSISYGTLGLGASTTAANNQEQTIAQSGNDVADVEVSSAAAMTCATGTIPVGNQQWAPTDVAYAGVGVTALSGIAVDTNLNVGYRHGANPTKTLYWNIAIPSNGVLGACTGTTTISAIAG